MGYFEARIDIEPWKFSAAKIWESLFTSGIERPLYCRGVVIWTSILKNKIRVMFS